MCEYWLLSIIFLVARFLFSYYYYIIITIIIIIILLLIIINIITEAC